MPQQSGREIYFVDEDDDLLRAWLIELELRGHRVVTFGNATDAFRELWRVPSDHVAAVMIDVMLDPGAEPDRYHPPFSTTGLELLRDLCQQNPATFPGRAILLTNATGPTLAEAVEGATQLSVPVWDKRSIMSPLHFGDRVEQFIAERGAA